MSLGTTEGGQNKPWRCGVEVEFDEDLPYLIKYNISGGFDFVVLPLVSSNYQSDSMKSEESGIPMIPLEASDVNFSPFQWKNHVVGKISSWIDLDSDNAQVRLASEKTLKEEILWASHLSLKACILPPPKTFSFCNYARWANHILEETCNMQLTIPLEDSESVDHGHTNVGSNLPGQTTFDSWEWWKLFRLQCEHHRDLHVVLDILSNMPSNSSFERWFGEPVTAAILHTSTFSRKKRGFPWLSIRLQSLITELFHHSVRIVISGSLLHNISSGDVHVEGLYVPPLVKSTRHELKPYSDYVEWIYRRIEPLAKQARLELGHRDVLLSPMQSLMDDVEAQLCKKFEKDEVKYNPYQRALCEALIDRVPDEKISTIVTVLMIVGAGLGSLVRVSLQAVEETGRKVRVYAVEKNRFATVTLHKLVKLRGWESFDIVIINDIRCFNAPERADILVGELFESFGDIELSTEFFDGAQRFLNPDGISIPSTYTSLLQPVTSTQLHNDVKFHKDLAHFESAYVVKMHHHVARLAVSQPVRMLAFFDLLDQLPLSIKKVFTFTHPEYSGKGNARYKMLQFKIPSDSKLRLVHGFAGYFVATLYKNVYLSTEPSIATPNTFSCIGFPMYFPLRNPLYVPSGSVIEAHFWRWTNITKVWYEWCVTSPSVSPIHNNNGRSSWVFQ